MPPYAPPTPAAGIRQRLAGLGPRERRFLAAGVAALLLFLLYLLWPRAEDPEVELAQAPPSSAQPAISEPTISQPMPAPAPPVAAPSFLSTPAGAGAAGGVILRGVMGGVASSGAAIFAYPDGSQRVVRIGRDLVPGTTLRRIGVDHVLASSPAGDIRLELNKAGAIAVAAAPAASGSPPAASLPQQQRETTQFRLGLEPVRRNGRVSGYSIRPGAAMPRLQAAGLRPGDVIVSVNGSALDEERLLELSWQLSNSGSTQFEYIRDGQRMKASLGTAK